VTTPAHGELDVQVDLNQLAGGQVELSVRVPPEPVAAVKDRVVEALARRANIPGFRKGKAPRALLHRYLDQDAVDEQVIEHLVSDAYEAAVEKAAIKPLDRARIADAALADDGSLTFKATVTLRPEITLGDHKGLTAARRISPVTDAQVDAEIERLRSRRAQYVDLPKGAGIEKGDLAVVDYDMIVEGEKREDASASGYPLEVGADQLFPELNETLLGAEPGDIRDLSITYPADHSDQTLAGKTATFKVTVKQARRRQLPALDDEFAAQVSDLQSLADLRGRIRRNLEAVGTALAEEDVREQLVRQVLESASLDVPEAIIGREVDRRVDDITGELERRGLSLNQHLAQSGRSFDDWRADIEADARQAARRALVLDEIGEREKIQVTEEEIHEEIRRRAEAEGMNEEQLRERLSDSAEFNRIVTRLYHRKIVQFLLDNAEVADEVVEAALEEEPQEAEEPEEAGPSQGAPAQEDEAGA
jgi:trigger factor